MQYEADLLEDWMREYYFETEIDLGSSGVHPYSTAQIKDLTGLPSSTLDAVRFEDSWALGAPGIRQAIAESFAGGDTDRVMATHGSSEAIFLTMNALVRPGDEVIALDPCYQQPRGASTAIHR